MLFGRNDGFSLVEILITLSILGIVGMFTVPKILNPPNSSQNSKYTTGAKEAAHMVMNAYQQYKMANGTVPSSFKIKDLTPYMNYVAIDSTSTIDDWYGYVSYSCNASYGGIPYLCLKLQNGGMLYLDVATFGGTSTTNGNWFLFDPDGRLTTNTTNGPGKSQVFMLYYDGAIREHANLRTNSGNEYGAFNACSSCTASWFMGI